MFRKVSLSNALITTIVHLYVLLFVYAAISKVIDFENFQIQIGQSPMLRSYVSLISYGIPAVELLVAFLLLTSRFKLLGLYASVTLMGLFSIYLFLLLQFSDYIPCSCGGILDKMSWEAHLVFNLLFLSLGIVALVFYYKNQRITLFVLIRKLILIFILSMGLMLYQFLQRDVVSSSVQHFIRYFPHHPIKFEKQLDLKFNSYYLAGFDSQYVYLGNVTAPLLVTKIDLKTYKKNEIQLQIPASDLKFRSLRLSVQDSMFYFFDGTTPIVYKGKTSDWSAKEWFNNVAYFTHLVPIDSTSVGIKALSAVNHTSVLGLITENDNTQVSLFDSILENTEEGLFASDGKFVYEPTSSQFIYSYYYRSAFLVLTSSLKQHTLFPTIDRTSESAPKVITMKRGAKNVLLQKPLTINKNLAVNSNYIILQSGVMGNYEPRESWKNSSIMDVYSLVDGAYSFSFYLPNQASHELDSFKITTNELFVIHGNYLTIYKLKQPFVKGDTILQYQGNDRKPVRE